MHITVFGANGRVGSLVVAEAARRGHTIRAFVYSTSENIAPHKDVQVIKGDATNIQDILPALQNTDVVVNCLGSWGTKTKDVQTQAMKAIIPAMKQQGIQRIVSLTGAEAHASSDKITLANRISHTLFSLFAGKILADGENHLQQLEQSGLGWTVVRSPAMTNKGKGSGYKFTGKRPSLIATIRRDSVAQALLDLVESNEYIKQSPFLTK